MTVLFSFTSVNNTHNTLHIYIPVPHLYPEQQIVITINYHPAATIQ